MNPLNQLVTRPKMRLGLTVGIALLWTLAAVISAVTWGSTLGTVALVTAVVLTGIALVLWGFGSAVDQREIARLRQRVRSGEELLDGVRKYTSQTEYRTRALEQLEAQLRTQQNALNALQAESKTLPAAVTTSISATLGGLVSPVTTPEPALPAGGEPRELGGSHGLYAPETIPAILPDKRSHQTVGRAAAAVAEDPRRAGILAQLLGETADAADSSDLPLVALVGGPHTREALAAVARVQVIAPSAVLIPPEASYAVVDLAAARSGRWAGMLESTGTTLYHPLADALTAARRRGTVVLVLEDGLSAGNFGPDLISRATITLHPGGAADAELDAWEDDITTPVLDRLRQIQRRRDSRKAAA